MSANGHITLTNDQSNLQIVCDSLQQCQLAPPPPISSSSSVNGIGRAITVSTKTLPSALLNKIFSYLHPVDRQPITHINPFFQNAIFLHGHTELESVKILITTMIKTCPQYASELSRIHEGVDTYSWIDSALYATTISKIQEILSSARTTLLSFLETKITPKDFNVLKDVVHTQERPVLFRYLFELAEINGDVKKIPVRTYFYDPVLQPLLHRLYSIREWNRAITIVYQFHGALWEKEQKKLCYEFVQALDSLDTLNQVAVAVEYEFQKSPKRWGEQQCRSMILAQIVRRFYSLNNLQKAITIASKIHGEKNLDEVLEQISFDEFSKGNLKMAFEVAKMLSSESRARSRVWQQIEQISFDEFSKGNLKMAFEMAQMLPSNSRACSRVWQQMEQISKNILEEVRGLCVQHMFDKAIERANDILCEKHKSKAFLWIIEKLYARGEFEKAAQQVRNMLLDDPDITKILDPFAKALCARVDLAMAIEVAYKITDQLDQSDALEAISQAWCAKGNLDKATEIADRIPIQYYQSTALEAISKAWCKKGNLDKATEIADRIPSQYPQSAALEAISEAWCEKGDLDKATEIAYRIPYDLQKSMAHKAILKAKEAHA